MKITKEAFKNIVRETMIEENEYQQLFKHMLDKTGKSIPDMSDDDKKKFFNAVDTAYKAKSEGKLRGYNENINEYDEWKNTRIQAKNIFRMLKQKYNNNISKMQDGLEDILKQNKTSNDQAEVMRDEFNKFFNIKEAELTAGQKKIDVDKDGEIEGSDLAALRAGKTVNEVKFYAFFNNKKHEIEGKDLLDAKQKAITMLKVPKSKVGLLAIVNANEHDKGSFRYESVNEAGTPIDFKFPKGNTSKEIEKLEAEYTKLIEKGSDILQKQKQLIRKEPLTGEYPWENYDKWPTKLKVEVEKLNLELEKLNAITTEMGKKLFKLKGFNR